LNSLQNIRKTEADFPRPEVIAEAAGIIRKGGLTVFPTSALYGIGVNALDPEAVDKIFRIKGRSSGKAILVLIGNPEEVGLLALGVPQSASDLMAHFWPGGLTIVLEAGPELPQNLTAGSGKIGIRLCRHPVAAALIRAAGGPITGTSANLSGSPGCSRISGLDSSIARNADLIIDAGTLKGGTGSTVVDMTSGFPEILREGTVPAKDILKIADRYSRNFVDRTV
jgi:L-threonylcarbamoyladenylate synthase